MFSNANKSQQAEIQSKLSPPAFYDEFKSKHTSIFIKTKNINLSLFANNKGVKNQRQQWMINPEICIKKSITLNLRQNKAFHFIASTHRTMR